MIRRNHKCCTNLQNNVTVCLLIGPMPDTNTTDFSQTRHMLKYLQASCSGITDFFNFCQWPETLNTEAKTSQSHKQNSIDRKQNEPSLQISQCEDSSLLLFNLYIVYLVSFFKEVNIFGFSQRPAKSNKIVYFKV